MVIFFEDSDYFFQLEAVFQEYNILAKGWRNYDRLSEHIRIHQPKLALLDIEIGKNKEAGLEALQLIKDRFPRVRTVILSGYPDYVLRAFRIGADGYLLKEDIAHSMEYIREVIGEVKEGKICMSNEVRRVIVEALAPYEKVDLNTRERQILCLAASDKSCPQIAQVLKLTPQTVETYFKNIKGKLNCHTIQGLVAKALRNNLILMEEFIS